ncbi:MAG: LPS assembly lipoprotein LptE [Gemmatimonadota bacterium]
MSLWLILLFPLALSSCGFKLRGAQQLPFETIYLGFPANSPLGSELARNIRAGTSTRVVETAKDAQAVFEVLGENRDREVLSVNAQGRAREFTLRQRLTFRLHDGKGSEYLGPTQVVVQRDVAFDDAQALAFEAETALLYRDMQTDLVQQILRRLAAVKGVRR